MSFSEWHNLLRILHILDRLSHWGHSIPLVMSDVYLRTARERKELTQEALAKKSLVAQNTISKLEKNPKARPVFETVKRLARALRVDPMRLRFGPDPRPKQRRRSPLRPSLSLKARLSA